jgi:hypothetical protein
MTTPRSKDRRKIDAYVPPEIHEALDSAADVLDVDLSVFLSAMAVGAVRKGHHVRFAMAAIDEIPHKRRARKRRQWMSESGTDVSLGGGAEASAWSAGDWTLVRLGHGNKYRKEGEGWFLEGPGVEDATHVGWTTGEAMENAEPIIRRWEQQQAKEAQAPTG